MRNFIIILLFLFTGCTTTVTSKVTNIYSAKFSNQGRSFFFLSPSDKQDDLEYKTYKEIIKSKLELAGYRVASNEKNADLGVRLYYKVGDAIRVNNLEPIYQYNQGQTVHYNGSGDAYNFHNGYTNYNYHSTATSNPTWDVIGYKPVVYLYYQKFLFLNIIDLKSKNLERLFESIVVNYGQESQFVSVGRCMIDALFKDFPGPNAVERSVEIDAKECQFGYKKINN